MAHAQGSLNLVFDIVYYPGHLSGDSPFTLAIATLLVVDVEVATERFSFGGIEVDLLLNKAIDVGVVDFDDKGVLGLWLVVHPHFCEGRQAAQGDGEGEEGVFRGALLGTDDILANGKLGELGQHVENYGHANILTLAQEAELGTSKARSKQILLAVRNRKAERGTHFLGPSI